MQLPSSLPFTSFLQYSPYGKSVVATQSRKVRDSIKNDWFLGNSNGIDYAGRRVAEEIQNYACLRKCFGPDVVLVPVPRSAPLSEKDALWPARRICESLLAVGLGSQIAELIVRETPVQKSATAEPGTRPNPPDHYRSIRIDESALDIFVSDDDRITLVDDVVTRGSTFIGMLPKVTVAFPRNDVRCFALARPIGNAEDFQIAHPVEGIITYKGGHLLRDP